MTFNTKPSQDIAKLCEELHGAYSTAFPRSLARRAAAALESQVKENESLRAELAARPSPSPPEDASAARLVQEIDRYITTSDETIDEIAILTRCRAMIESLTRERDEQRGRADEWQGSAERATKLYHEYALINAARGASAKEGK